MSIIVQAYNAQTKQWETRNALRSENMALIGGKLSYNDVVYAARQYATGWRADITNSLKPIRIYDNERKEVL